MHIPIEELDRRRDVLQKKLQLQDMDGALLAQNMTMYYLTGTMQCQYVYVPATGPCLGLVRRNMERASEETPVPLRRLAGFSGLPSLLAETGQKPSRLGLELDIMPAALYLRIAKVFSCETADVSTAVRETRQVKSAYELKQLRQAARQVDAMHRLIPEFLVEGKEELVFAAELENSLRRLGHQGIARMRGFNQEMFFGHVLSGISGGMASFLDSPTGGPGVSPAQPQGPGRKIIRRGEPVTVDYGGIHNGYIVDQTRLYSVGPIKEELKRAFEAALLIQERICENLAPGISGNEIFEIAVAVAQKAGLSENFMGFGDTQAKFVGHGLGLEFDEFPILAKGSPHLLGEDYVVALEPKFIFPTDGMVGIENTWRVTAGKPEKISITPDGHLTVS
ncbi:MAG: aminopeptidase P family protein [Clostridiales bacterium]|nr:aminopeptidase P family protein [Clostridiales bacterium]